MHCLEEPEESMIGICFMLASLVCIIRAPLLDLSEDMLGGGGVRKRHCRHLPPWCAL